MITKEMIEKASEKYFYGCRDGGQRKIFIEGVNWCLENISKDFFVCDGCGEEKSINEKIPMVDENFNIQKGMFECAECKGLCLF